MWGENNRMETAITKEKIKYAASKFNDDTSIGKHDHHYFRWTDINISIRNTSLIAVLVACRRSQDKSGGILAWGRSPLLMRLAIRPGSQATPTMHFETLI